MPLTKNYLDRRSGARRRVQAFIGAAKEELLPANVVMVVHKPGYQKHREAVKEVYEAHGITSVHLRPMRFTERMVRDNYEQVFRRFADRPELKNEIIGAYAARDRHPNIAVEFLHVPQSTIAKLGVENAWAAIKKIAGKTNPEAAEREMSETRITTIRGTAHRDNPGKTTTLHNVVHVPDPAKIASEQGYITGRHPDLALFAPFSTLTKVWFKHAKLKRAGKLRE